MPTTPQQKKLESYQKDRRNTYGENAKSWRKSIARRKRLRSRTERHIARLEFRRDVALDEILVEAAAARVQRKHRSGWQKFPDEPLGIVVRAKRARRRRIAIVGWRLRQSMRVVR